MKKQVDFNSSDDDDFDLDEEYFARTYQPLSNLPTPPPSSRDWSAAQSPRSLLEDGGLLDSALLGSAIHLVNLIPPAASLATPSVALVHEMLVRADVPLDTIALAVCILDSLSPKFSLNWRLLCPLAHRDSPESGSKRHTFSASPAVGYTVTSCTQLHIDCVNPELIALASLVIAVKFLEDRQDPTHYYRTAWGKDMWTSEQINVTERCIMESLGYRILPLWDPELIADAINDMERAGRRALLPLQCSDANLVPLHTRSVSTGGKSVVGLGLQLTPVETPTSEKGPSAAQSTAMDDICLGSGLPGPALDSLHLPVRTKRKKSIYSSD